MKLGDFLIKHLGWTLEDVNKRTTALRHLQHNRPEQEFLDKINFLQNEFGLTNCIAKEILDAGYSVIYLTSHELFDILETKVFHQEKMDDMVRSVVSMLYTCDLLIIDDLGTEFITPFSRSTIYNIFNKTIYSQLSY